MSNIKSQIPNSRFQQGFTRIVICPRRTAAGFTLIELIVSISLFIVVSLISIGGLLAIVEANRKSQSFKTVVNNLSFGLESLSKTMRVGNTYHCGSGGSINDPQNCPGGDSFIAYERSGGTPGDSSDQIVYRLNSNTIERSTDGGGTYLSVTSSEVEVTDFSVYVFGSAPSDGLQPRVLIIIRGNVDLGKNARTEFNIQTNISQRDLDT
jgi:type II secretory pathway component PulJ